MSSKNLKGIKIPKRTGHNKTNRIIDYTQVFKLVLKTHYLQGESV